MLKLMSSLFYSLTVSSFLFISIAVIFTSVTKAKDAIPTAPEGCFDNAAYCSNNTVIREGGQRYIVVHLYGIIDAENFEIPQSLLDAYMDFSRWPEYINGSDYLNIIKSQEIILNPQVKGLRRHYVTYSTKAPFPINKVYIREVADYIDISGQSKYDSDVAVKFDIIKGNHQVPGEPLLVNYEGIKYKHGEIYVRKNTKDNNYYVYADVRIIPEIDLLPTVAAPYIEGSVVAIFKGVFGI
ncbi:MAG: hypothetical protein HQK51_07195 [Oligoflexia bacterium]|nr:hypothetical protein [Oligoflexia bacterium]